MLILLYLVEAWDQVFPLQSGSSVLEQVENHHVFGLRFVQLHFFNCLLSHLPFPCFPSRSDMLCNAV